MPNLPIQDAQGIFTFFLNTNITKADSKKLSKLFSKFGKAFEIKDEKLFDPATALFGSGPAYIFALQEIFTEIAISHKIEIEDAQNLVNQLFLGSSLMSSNSNLNFTSLRENVVSKGGTTDAALQILQKNSALKNLFKDAINAACAKSMELSDK
jgi:pyrroline-5-carboxylate reductase